MWDENYPASSSNIEKTVTVGAIGALSIHWRNYYSTPEHERDTDESILDEILPTTLVELGFPRQKAQDLCKIAKLEAMLQLEAE
jgi:hypothetical protein